jgi:hypothetical protein
MNLETLIDQWIGEDKWETEKISPDLMTTNYLNGDRDCRQDLKSRKQELIEALEKNYEITERF